LYEDSAIEGRSNIPLPFFYKYDSLNSGTFKFVSLLPTLSKKKKLCAFGDTMK